jgi:hypothetical protein
LYECFTMLLLLLLRRLFCKPVQGAAHPCGLIRCAFGALAQLLQARAAADMGETVMSSADFALVVFYAGKLLPCMLPATQLC